MGEKRNLKAVSDDELLRRLSELVDSSRWVEADLIAHIAEVETRRLNAREATPSMFAYCTERLHLSEQEAYLRITVARASREHPVLLAMLRDGRLHLSGICKLAPHLAPDNRDALLRDAAHKSKRQIEESIAALVPRPEAPAEIRKLPGRRDGGSTATTIGLGPGRVATSHSASGGGVQIGAAAAELSGDAGAAGGGLPGLDPGPVRAPREGELGPDRVAASARTRPGLVEPVGPARFRVRFDASAELRDKLERLQALMRSSVPDGDLGQVIDLAVTRELDRLEARRFAKTKKPRQSLAQTDTTPKSRHIPAAVRRAVHKRDGGRCSYKDRHGRRCTKRHDLEFHHRKPFARGGEHSPEVLCLMCRTHAALMAEHDFGREVVAQHQRSGRRLEASRVSEVRVVYASETRRSLHGGDPG